jgi:hypothetical protein
MGITIPGNGEAGTFVNVLYSSDRVFLLTYELHCNSADGLVPSRISGSDVYSHVLQTVHVEI